MGILDTVRNAAKSFGTKMGGLTAASNKLKSLGEIMSVRKITNGVKFFSKYAFVKMGGRDKAIEFMDGISKSIESESKETANLIIHGQTHEQIEGEKQNKEKNLSNKETLDDGIDMG